MEKDMLQSDGTVVFPIRLPKTNSSTSVAKTAANAEPKSTRAVAKEIKHRTTSHNFTSVWSSVIQYCIVLVSLAILHGLAVTI